MDTLELWAAVAVQGLIDPSPALHKWCRQRLNGMLGKWVVILSESQLTSWTTLTHTQTTLRGAAAAASVSSFGNQLAKSVFMQGAMAVMRSHRCAH